MNMLLSYYIDKNSIPEWKEKFSSAAQNVIMYKFKGTNGRYLNSFDVKFNGFKEVEGIPRDNWPVYDNGQDIHKQYTVPMIEAKLFYKENDIYHKTEKGKLFEKYLNLDMSLEEKWIINFLLLADATICNRENYIINRSVEIESILKSNTSEEFLTKACKELFFHKDSIGRNVKEICKYDYLYLNSFYLEPEFLKLYYSASEQDRNELKTYVFHNWENKMKNCCVAEKYFSTKYSVPELIDDLKIFMFSIKINKIKYQNFDNTMVEIIQSYAQDYDINMEIVKEFIFENKNIFEPILMNIYNVEENLENEENEIDTNIEDIDIPVGDRPEPRIDDTTMVGKTQLNTIFNVRKKIAREKAGYKCALEEYKGCRYFTAKSTNHNYVEIHHFVPREFRNNFEYSVEILPNYIALCPHCHRMIHLATDRERVDIIRYIYNKRSEELHKKGIDVELKELFAYYNIEEA